MTNGTVPVGVSDPNDPTIPFDSESPTGELDPVIQVPPTQGSVPMADDTTVQDLYPTDPGVVAAEGVDVPDPTGADVVTVDPDVGVVDVPGEADTSTGRIEETLDVGGGGIDAEQTGLTPEMQVDMELARILEQDSPLMQRARQEAMRTANTRGLQNTSMAVGMAQGALVDRALPMAAQNAQQALQRELDNTLMRQDASKFTAEQQNQLMEIEATLGMELNIFNADQLNQAARLTAELQTAIEQGNQQAQNEINMQLAQLQRDAQAQQADIDFKQNQAVADARNALNAQIMDNINSINQQFLTNMGAADVANIQGTYNVLIQQNATAGTMFNGALAAMAAVMDDPDMTPSQVSTALRHIQTTLLAGMEMLEEINQIPWEDEGGGGTDTGGGTTTPPTTTPPGGGGGGEYDSGTDSTSSGAGEGCFAAGTCFRMADGSLKKIEDIKLHDEMETGGRVTMVLVADGSKEQWFDVDGVHVTGAHLIEKDGRWMFVKDAGAERTDTHDTLYTVVNEDHRMVAENGQVFGDFADTAYDDGSDWNDFLLATLNGETQFSGWESRGGIRRLANPSPPRRMFAA